MILNPWPSKLDRQPSSKKIADTGHPESFEPAVLYFKTGSSGSEPAETQGTTGEERKKTVPASFALDGDCMKSYQSPRR